MGTRCYREGLQDGIVRETPIQWNLEVPPLKVLKSAVIKRGGRYVSKVCYTQDNFQCGFYSRIFLALQKIVNDVQYKTAGCETSFEKTSLQIVDPSRYDSGGGGVQLLDFSGSEGCLFPQSSLEIPEILCGVCAVQVLSLALRDNNCASYFHHVGSGCKTSIRREIVDYAHLHTWTTSW